MGRGHTFRTAQEAEAAAQEALRAAKDLLAQTGACASPQTARLIRAHLADVDSLMGTARRLQLRERVRDQVDQQVAENASGSRFEAHDEQTELRSLERG